VPFLRFTRDRRGYENTILVHTTRRRGREHARVLYWYRSPPHIKVGRPALDEEAIRTLEQTNPDIVFDWSAILDARPEAEPPEPSRKRRERDTRGQPSPPDRTAFSPSRTEAATPTVPDEHRALGIPAPLDDGLDEAGLDVARPPRAVEPSAAEVALGAEGLARLRVRHAEVLARIGEQIADPARAEELRLLAVRLDPDAWVTAGDVASGLEHFEATLDTIRRELGPPRARRSTHRGRGRPVTGSGARAGPTGHDGEPRLADDTVEPPPAAADDRREDE
jgi:hypothetical protein